MHEHFHGNRRLGRDCTDFGCGQFARQDHALNAEPLAHERDAARLSERHLSRGMDRQSRGEFMDQVREPEILDDDRIHTGVCDGLDVLDC